MADAKTDTFENIMLSMIFNATTFSGLVAATTGTNIALSLHTASPGETGDQTSNEATYTGYARVGTERTSSGWTVSGTTAKLTSTVSFPQCSGGSNTITHFGIGLSTVAASTGTLLYYGTVTPNITVTNGVTPRLTTNTAVSEL